MGASNVAKVFTHWAHLEHRDARGLAYMANVAMDQDAPPLYFGGPDALAAAVGHQPSDKPESTRRTAVRVLAALTKAGAIVSSGQARPGVRAEYALALDPVSTYVPAGNGRNVKWSEAPRSPEPETPTVAPSEREPETATVAPPETARVSTCDSQGLKGETARGTPRKELQEQPQEYIEEQLISSALVSPAREEISEANDEDLPPDPEDKPLEERTAAWQMEQLMRRQTEYERQEAERKTS